MIPKVSNDADRDEKREWLSDLVRIVILIWSAGLLTASYVRLPGGQKVMDFDPTFIASVFSGSLAGFGVAVAKNATAGNGNGNGSSPSLPETPVYARPPKEEEEKKEEPEVQPLWEDATPEPEVSVDESTEPVIEEESEPPSEEGEGFVRPRRGDL